MTVNHPGFIISGVFAIGYLLPEWILLMSKRHLNIPFMQNLMSGAAFGLIAAGVLLS